MCDNTHNSCLDRECYAHAMYIHTLVCHVHMVWDTAM